MNILIADDSGTARMFIRQCLEISGQDDAQYLEAKDGQEALQLLKENSVDLIVTDLNMPVIDGRELLKRVVASPKLNSIPVLVITSSGNEARRQELLELGAKAVLRKPVNPATISEGLEAVFVD